MVGWRPEAFSIDVLYVSTQLIHCKIEPSAPCPGFFCSLVYGYNERAAREALWRALEAVKTDDPWIVMGDFNSVLNLDERIGYPVRASEVQTFRDCIMHCKLSDVKYNGRSFTWTNKQDGDSIVFFMLDIVIGNDTWIQCCGNAIVSFFP